MGDNFDIHKWKKKILMESLEESGEVKDQTPKNNNFSQAEDNLYKKVTGKDSKSSSKNKFRDKKEVKEDKLERGTNEYQRKANELLKRLRNLTGEYDEILDIRDINGLLDDAKYFIKK